jgi:16S rRNA (guanine966-N2)-methyltransferase
MPNNTLRIIGGKWRSRQLTLPDVAQVRPTPNRLRETLFNWLAADIVGANCLDAFAGSGALGFEAASRGASNVVLVDCNKRVCQQLENNKTILKADNVQIDKTDFLQQTLPAWQPFDIVFLDPPFNQGLLPACLKKLLNNNLLAEQAWVYVETEISLDKVDLPAKWQVCKQKRAGDVFAALLKLAPQ